MNLSGDEGGDLKSVNVQFCYQISDRVLDYFKTLNKLRELCVKECAMRTDVVISFKQNNPNVNLINE
jgi:hypothetical protein